MYHTVASKKKKIYIFLYILATFKMHVIALAKLSNRQTNSRDFLRTTQNMSSQDHKIKFVKFLANAAEVTIYYITV